MKFKKAEMEQKVPELLVMLILCLVAIAIVTMLVVNTYKSAVGTDISGKVSYWYLENTNFKNPSAVINAKTSEIRFIKKGNSVEINTKTLLSGPDCPTIDTSGDITKQKILLMPAMGAPEDEKIYYLPDYSGTGRTVKEYEEARKTADYVKLKLREAKVPDSNLVIPEQKAISADEQKKVAEAVNPTIFVHVEAGEIFGSSENKITAIINPKDEKSKKLACIILNSLLSSDVIKKYNVDTKISETGSALLSDKYPGVVLQIGSFRTEQGTRLFIENFEISQGIGLGIENYFMK